MLQHFGREPHTMKRIMKCLKKNPKCQIRTIPLTHGPTQIWKCVAWEISKGSSHMHNHVYVHLKKSHWSCPSSLFQSKDFFFFGIGQAQAKHLQDSDDTTYTTAIVQRSFCTTWSNLNKNPKYSFAIISDVYSSSITFTWKRKKNIKMA